MALALAQSLVLKSLVLTLALPRQTVAADAIEDDDIEDDDGVDQINGGDNEADLSADEALLNAALDLDL